LASYTERNFGLNVEILHSMKADVALRVDNLKKKFNQLF